LKHQREEITGNENPWIPAGTNATVFSSECVYDAAEAEINTSGVECRGDSEANDLDEEWVLRHNM